MTEIIGWAGALCIVTAYLLTTYTRLTPQTLLYQSLNTVGGLGIVVASVAVQNWSSAALNVFWCLIGLTWIIRSRLKQAA